MHIVYSSIQNYLRPDRHDSNLKITDLVYIQIFFPSAVQSWCICCRVGTDRPNQSSISVDYTPGGHRDRNTTSYVLPTGKDIFATHDEIRCDKYTSGRLSLQRHKTIVDSPAIHLAHDLIFTIQKQPFTQAKICTSRRTSSLFATQQYDPLSQILSSQVRISTCQIQPKTPPHSPPS